MMHCMVAKYPGLQTMLMFFRIKRIFRNSMHPSDAAACSNPDEVVYRTPLLAAPQNMPTDPGNTNDQPNGYIRPLVDLEDL